GDQLQHGVAILERDQVAVSDLDQTALVHADRAGIEEGTQAREALRERALERALFRRRLVEIDVALRLCFGDEEAREAARRGHQQRLCIRRPLAVHARRIVGRLAVYLLDDAVGGLRRLG